MTRHKANKSKPINPCNESNGDVNGALTNKNTTDTSKKRPPDNNLESQPPHKKRNESCDKLPKRKIDGNDGDNPKRRKVDTYYKTCYFNHEEKEGKSPFKVISINISKTIRYFKCEPINFILESNFQKYHNQILNYLICDGTDIMCLQEVPESYWNKCLEQLMRIKGFSCDFVETEHNCLNIILYNPNKFVKTHVERNSLSSLCQKAIESSCNYKNNSVKQLLSSLSDTNHCIICIYKVKTTQPLTPSLIVCNSHISSNNGQIDQSCLQTSGIFWSIKRILDDVGDSVRENENPGPDSPFWLWCSDFSCNSHTLRSLCQVGYLNDDAVNELNNSQLFNKFYHAFQHTHHIFDSYMMQEFANEVRYIWIHQKLVPISQQVAQQSSKPNTTNDNNNNGDATTNLNDNNNIDMTQHLYDYYMKPLMCTLNFPK